MDKYIGFGVSLQTTHVCVVDSEGKTVREGIAASEVDALATWLRTHGKECGEKSGVSSSFLPEKVNRHRITLTAAAGVVASGEIRCQFIILARKDERTPDYPHGCCWGGGVKIWSKATGFKMVSRGYWARKLASCMRSSRSLSQVTR